MLLEHRLKAYEKMRHVKIPLTKLFISIYFFLSIWVEFPSYAFATVASVSAFKAPFWQRIDIAFHTATHSVTGLPFPPQGLLSWELACQPETMWRWRVRGVRFDWDMEEMEEERVGREGYSEVISWNEDDYSAVVHTLSFFLRCSQRSYYLLAAMN